MKYKYWEISYYERDAGRSVELLPVEDYTEEEAEERAEEELRNYPKGEMKFEIELVEREEGEE